MERRPEHRVTAEHGEPVFIPMLRGRFFRAIDPRFREHALSGSRVAGRYSRPGQSTLYMSASVEGVETALIAHAGARAVELEIIQLDVEARNIADLRDPELLAKLSIDVADAVAPWQEAVATGGTPRSWTVRDRLIAAGAHGLIDPSRKRPELWHLVLFHWNDGRGPVVRLRES